MSEEQEKWPKLDPEFKAKWIAALRSGEYEQAHNKLCVDTLTKPAFCCLGLAGHLVGISCDDMRARQLVTSNDSEMPGFTNYPPQLVLRTDRYNELPKKLARMNDGIDSETKSVTPYTFPMIADWIEENL